MEYDYTQEQYVRELWIAEGITSYFDDLMLVWADLCTREEYLVRLSKNIQTVQAAPGRLVQPLEQSSWDAWTKHYRPDENSQNSRISYYLKGAIVAWLLDTRLRIATDGVQHLAGVMQRLWRDFRHTGYTLRTLNALSSCVAVQRFASGCTNRFATHQNSITVLVCNTSDCDSRAIQSNERHPAIKGPVMFGSALNRPTPMAVCTSARYFADRHPMTLG